MTTKLKPVTITECERVIKETGLWGEFNSEVERGLREMQQGRRTYSEFREHITRGLRIQFHFRIIHGLESYSKVFPNDKYKKYNDEFGTWSINENLEYTGTTEIKSITSKSKLFVQNVLEGVEVKSEVNFAKCVMIYYFDKIKEIYYPFQIWLKNGIKFNQLAKEYK
jgi:hypothetical protein